MDDDETYEETDTYEETESLPSIRWSWLVLVMRVVEIVRNVLRAVAGGLDMVVGDIASHYNYEHDRRTFADEARADIERITAGLVPGSEGEDAGTE